MKVLSFPSPEVRAYQECQDLLPPGTLLSPLLDPPLFPPEPEPEPEPVTR